ncbi:deleted in malignant brain tumors 1 protein-like [Patiria miniata]|uniref:SRCR domain-containing protein n=1 Tax=Patiria miniata TaxID=46514 RepID=A0A914ACD7_PATMI|nr:deleted in malignant brain tumors 1 protein-like [Patiria miniata]
METRPEPGQGPGQGPGPGAGLGPSAGSSFSDPSALQARFSQRHISNHDSCLTEDHESMTKRYRHCSRRVSCVSSIRLSGGAVNHEGRVELFNNNAWGTVCHHGWDLNDAKVACRQLGFPDALLYTVWAAYGGGTGAVLLSYPRCVGSEADLWSCPHDGGGDHGCNYDHQHDAGVVCSPSVRLVNGASTNAGRLEVYFNGQWGTVCDDGWSLDEATVVCRQLGLGDAQKATHNAYFGPGTGDILLGNVSCSGNEDTLMDCSHPPVGTHHCTHMEDAGVICQAQASIRLSGGAANNEGRVELFYNSVWGTVCHWNWRLNDAKVACRQLGFPGALLHTTNAAYGGGTGPVLLSNVGCVGNEADLWSCGHSGVGGHWCTHDYDAGVVCSPSG